VASIIERIDLGCASNLVGVLVSLTATGHMLTRGGAKVLRLYSRTNFKLNRAAALAEWRQLLSA